MDAVVDGARIFYKSVGEETNYPLIVLHGGPGFDHTEMHPWMDSLSDTFRLIYVDERGQGRSDRVDPRILSLHRFAEDVTKLAAAIGLEDREELVLDEVLQRVEPGVVLPQQHFQSI
jgi:proline iminopeptidase